MRGCVVFSRYAYRMAAVDWNFSTYIYLQLTDVCARSDIFSSFLVAFHCVRIVCFSQLQYYTVFCTFYLSFWTRFFFRALLLFLLSVRSFSLSLILSVWLVSYTAYEGAKPHGSDECEYTQHTSEWRQRCKKLTKLFSMLLLFIRSLCVMCGGWWCFHINNDILVCRYLWLWKLYSHITQS